MQPRKSSTLSPELVLADCAICLNTLPIPFRFLALFRVLAASNTDSSSSWSLENRDGTRERLKPSYHGMGWRETHSTENKEKYNYSDNWMTFTLNYWIIPLGFYIPCLSHLSTLLVHEKKLAWPCYLWQPVLDFIDTAFCNRTYHTSIWILSSFTSSMSL